MVPNYYPPNVGLRINPDPKSKEQMMSQTISELQNLLREDFGHKNGLASNEVRPL
jgi:hypothetical protein